MKGYAKQIKDALGRERRGRAPQRRLPGNHSPDSPEATRWTGRAGIGRRHSREPNSQAPQSVPIQRSRVIIQSMRVAIDVRKLHDFGIGTYIRNLLRHLARIDRESEYILLCHEPDMGVAESLGDNFRTVLEPARQLFVQRTDSRALGADAREA